LVSDIPARDGKTANLFLQCRLGQLAEETTPFCHFLVREWTTTSARGMTMTPLVYSDTVPVMTMPSYRSYRCTVCTIVHLRLKPFARILNSLTSGIKFFRILLIQKSNCQRTQRKTKKNILNINASQLPPPALRPFLLVALCKANAMFSYLVCSYVLLGLRTLTDTFCAATLCTSGQSGSCVASMYCIRGRRWNKYISSPTGLG
jgi:hypothetical protein